MCASKLRSMTSQTFLPVVRNALSSRWLPVRIMTASARHSVARFFLTRTLRQCLELANGSQAAALLISNHKIANEVGQVVSRPIVVNVSPRPLDCSLAFEMALHADRVT